MRECSEGRGCFYNSTFLSHFLKFTPPKVSQTSIVTGLNNRTFLQIGREYLPSKYANAVVLDIVTGEKLTDLNPGDRIVRGESVKNYKEVESDQLAWMQKEPFGKVYQYATTKLAKKLSKAEHMVFLYLIGFVRYGSGVLAFSNGRYVTRASIAKELNVSLRTVDAALNRLRQHKILRKSDSWREVQYYMNPYVVSVGREINKTLHEMFKNSSWAQDYTVELAKRKKNN